MDQSWSNLLKNLDNGMTGKELSSMWEDTKNENAPIGEERKAALNGSPVPSEGIQNPCVYFAGSCVSNVWARNGYSRPLGMERRT